MPARRTRKTLPAMLIVAACGSSRPATDAGSDAGTDPCPHSDAGYNDAGMRCVCEVGFSSTGPSRFECCDPDLGNPCPVCCFNPREADGGRSYYPDSGTPLCFC